jgi:hypothetical protein
MLLKQASYKVTMPKSFEDLYFKEEIVNFIDAQIRDWKRTNGSIPFSALALFGKSKFKDWCDIPLDKIYQYNLERYDGDSIKAQRQSGIDVGHLLKWRCSQYPANILVQHGYFTSYQFI